jgi:hypothetical protein
MSWCEVVLYAALLRPTSSQEEDAMRCHAMACGAVRCHGNQSISTLPDLRPLLYKIPPLSPPRSAPGRAQLRRAPAASVVPFHVSTPR